MGHQQPQELPRQRNQHLPSLQQEKQQSQLPSQRGKQSLHQGLAPPPNQSPSLQLQRRENERQISSAISWCFKTGALPLRPVAVVCSLSLPLLRVASAYSFLYR